MEAEIQQEGCQFRDLQRLSACQSRFLCLGADSQEDRPLVGSYLLAFTNGRSYRSGGLVGLILQKSAEGPPQRNTEQLGFPAYTSWKCQPLHRERLEGFGNFPSMLYFPHICYFISCFCIIVTGKPNMEAFLAPIREMEEGRE